MNWDNTKSRHGSVGIKMGYGLGAQGSNPGRSNIFLSSTNPDRNRGPPNLLSNRYRGLFPGG
jgi:hypothetical protein